MEKLAEMIFILVVFVSAILIVAVGIVGPIEFGIGAVVMIVKQILPEAAMGLLVEGAMTSLFAWIIGTTLLYYHIRDKYWPTPDDSKEMRKYRRKILPYNIGVAVYVLLIAAIVLIAVLATPVVCGICCLVLTVITLATVVTYGITKIKN